MTRVGWVAVRRVLNTINLSTPAGRLLARRHGVPVRPGPHGLVIAVGYPRAFPAARNPAVTVGDVVLLRMTEDVLAGRPRLLDHEARHADQWALLVGPVGFLPLYGIASAWSWLRTGHPGWANLFEVWAGLADGGYHRDPRRRSPVRGWLNGRTVPGSLRSGGQPASDGEVLPQDDHQRRRVPVRDEVRGRGRSDAERGD